MLVDNREEERMKKMMGIPKEDMDTINSSFKAGQSSTVIRKEASGHVVTVEKAIVNSRGYVIKDYRGRILCRNKSKIKNGMQYVVARKGQRYDDVPLELREQVTWSDEDFM